MLWAALHNSADLDCCYKTGFMFRVQQTFFGFFMKLGVALRGMIPYNRFIGSDVFSRTSGRDCGIKTTIQRKQSMENHKAGTDGDALSVSLVFVPFCCVEVSFFLWISVFGEWSFCVQKAMERSGLMGKMEKIQTDKKEVQRERKKPEQTEQTKQAAVCIGQNEQKEVKYGRYRVTSTFAGTENLTDLLECYIDRVGSLRYGA